MTHDHHPAETWQERAALRKQVAAEARALPREPAVAWVRAVLGSVTTLWLAALAWSLATLPERVPIHWSSFEGIPDSWASKPVALTLSFVLPLVLVYPLLWLSRLVFVAPDLVNVPHKEWWLRTPRRLARFERLLREDVMLLVSATLLLMVVSDVQIGYAAHQPDGRVSGWTLYAPVGGFLALTALILLRMMMGGRYRPHEEDSESS